MRANQYLACITALSPGATSLTLSNVNHAGNGETHRGLMSSQYETGGDTNGCLRQNDVSVSPE